MAEEKLSSYDFKINNIIYSMIGTSPANIRKNLLDYDLPDVPKGIKASKRSPKGARQISDDYKRKRFMGVPIAEIDTPRGQRTFQSQLKGW